MPNFGRLLLAPTAAYRRSSGPGTGIRSDRFAPEADMGAPLDPAIHGVRSFEHHSRSGSHLTDVRERVNRNLFLHFRQGEPHGNGISEDEMAFQSSD